MKQEEDYKASTQERPRRKVWWKVYYLYL